MRIISLIASSTEIVHALGRASLNHSKFWPKSFIPTCLISVMKELGGQPSK